MSIVYLYLLLLSSVCLLSIHSYIRLPTYHLSLHQCINHLSSYVSSVSIYIYLYVSLYIYISLSIFSVSTDNLAIIYLSVSICYLYLSIYIIDVCIPMVIYLYNHHLSIHPSTYLCIIYIYCLSVAVVIIRLLSIVHHPFSYHLSVCLCLSIYLSSVYPPAYLSRLSVYRLCLLLFLFIYPPIYLSSLSVYIIYMSIIITCLPVYPSIHPFTYLSPVCICHLSTYLPICPSTLVWHGSPYKGLPMADHADQAGVCWGSWSKCHPPPAPDQSW